MTREEAIKVLKTENCYECSYGYGETINCPAEDCPLPEAVKMAIKALEQEPKTRHWIISPNDCFVHCSECGLHGAIGIYKHYGWCPNCGARMVEPQETETWNGIHAQITAPKGTFERIFNEVDDENDI